MPIAWFIFVVPHRRANEHSSRSHLLLCVSVAGVHAATGTRTRGRLWLVDLAGSERVSKSGATGPRLAEAKHINRSLSALGDVIAARANKRRHVPYRNSVLTSVMEASLGGHGKALMFVALNPCIAHADESCCSLNFASRVRRVEMGKAKQHVVAGQQQPGGGGAGGGTGPAAPPAS